MNIDLTYPEGATPLDPDEILGLKPGLQNRAGFDVQPKS